MKKILFSLIAVAFALSMSAQTSFPRKHLIEHFTGEQCGYCPYGMESIEAFLATTTKDYIWVSHHYGYGTDEYTIAANSTIGKKLGVNGAPSVVFDRTKRRANGGASAYSFHPAYLTEKGAVTLNDADTSLVSVVIEHTYDAATRQLSLIVSGQVLDTTLNALKLSVLIKESGTVGAQSDYYGSWEGWSEFRHVKTVRDMLTAALGDVVMVDSLTHTYADTITYTVPGTWVDNNCAIVAYVTKNMSTVQPILNAEQAPLVAGTDGGENLLSGGITMVPVSDTYPEEGSPLADIDFTTKNVNTDYLKTYGYVTLTLQSAQNIRYDGYACTPYLQVIVFTKTADLSGTYPISNNYDYGVVAAGYRDDEKFDVGGSMFYYVYNQGGNLYPMAQWLLVDGTLIAGENGSIEINATTLNGSRFHGTYNLSTDVTNSSLVKNAIKSVRGSQLMIEKNGLLYNAQGAIIR